MKRFWAESTRESVGDWVAINSCVKRCGNWTIDLPAVSTKVLSSSGESLVNQDTQRIAPDDGVVVVCLKPESSVYVVN